MPPVPTIKVTRSRFEAARNPPPKLNNDQIAYHTVMGPVYVKEVNGRLAPPPIPLGGVLAAMASVKASNTKPPPPPVPIGAPARPGRPAGRYNPDTGEYLPVKEASNASLPVGVNRKGFKFPEQVSLSFL
jgi:hypothetical protein